MWGIVHRCQCSASLEMWVHRTQERWNTTKKKHTHKFKTSIKSVKPKRNCAFVFECCMMRERTHFVRLTIRCKRYFILNAYSPVQLVLASCLDRKWKWKLNHIRNKNAFHTRLAHFHWVLTVQCSFFFCSNNKNIPWLFFVSGEFQLMKFVPLFKEKNEMFFGRRSVSSNFNQLLNGFDHVLYLLL